METETEEHGESTTVTVDIPADEPTVVDTSDTVVVVTPPPVTESSTVSDPILDRLMTTDQRLNEIAELVAHQNEVIAGLAVNQATTAEVVDAVVETQIETAIAETDTTDEIVPDTRHFWFRPITSWFGRD